jgi:hypothetical protein
MKTSKILTLSLAAGVAGVAVAEITGARALFVSGETFFATLSVLGIGAIALADQLRHRRVGEVREKLIHPALPAVRQPHPYFARHSQVNDVCKAA